MTGAGESPSADARPGDGLRAITHRSSGVRLGLPAAWVVYLDPVPDVAVIALEPFAGPDGFRANVVLTLGPLAGQNLQDWQSRAERAFPDALRDYHLIDFEPAVICGGRGARRLAHHVAPGDVPVTMEQWVTVAGDIGHTLTCTVATARYGLLALLFPAIAGSLRCADPSVTR